MKREHITTAIESLKNKHKVFHSEADFQFSLAWELQTILPDAKIRLEYCPPFAREMHIDIYVIDKDGTYPIELKYKSKKLETIVDNEYFKLKNHSAQDNGRYDYLYDISRVERIKMLDNDFNGGYAIMLTNEPSYWKNTVTSKTVDADFRIHEGRVVNGVLAWADNASVGTIKGRTEPINLIGQYNIHWDTYSNIPDTVNGLFRVCIVSVKQ